uniref:Peptidase S1 domain-containing protein n=1 Tax=Amphimedon queenslandica TaxID=400682 RepID=A0A1X7VJU7_AMPQE
MTGVIMALITYNPSVWPYSDSFCGGIIIGKTKVLTAYHCTIKSLQTHEVFQNEDVIITVGVLNKTSAYESTRAVYSVKAIYRLSVISTNRDVSIIELTEEINFTEHVRPICLPMKSHDSHPTPGTECIVSGYGWTSSSGPSANILRQGTVQIVSWDECRNHFTFISSDTMCTSSGEEGIGSCPNDSGGPLACRRNNGQWVVFGIVGGGNCAMTNGYNYYSNVSSNLAWIKFPIYMGTVFYKNFPSASELTSHLSANDNL